MKTKSVWDIVKTPVITEKAVIAKDEIEEGASQVLTFRVDQNSTKTDIKKAV